MALILTGAAGSTTLDSSAGLTFSDSSNQSAAASPFGLKNRIINGAMVIDQRNAGASVTQSNSLIYPTDRWFTYGSVASKFTAQQQTSVVPTGYTYATKITSSSAYTVGANEYFIFGQRIEGFNTADLAWGTANAKTITVSFWVYSSLTGTFGGQLENNDATRSYPFTYTISSANTWEQKTITIAGDTSGTWYTNNSTGVQICFSLGAGSTRSGPANTWAATEYLSATGAVSVVGTNGATWYITGVQLERNTTATPFEWRPYGMELALCQRYYYRLVNGTVSNIRYVLYAAYNATRVFGQFSVPVAMRTSSPTGSFGSGTYVVLEKPDLTASYPITMFAVYSGTLSSNTNMMGMEINVASGLTANSLYYLTLLGGGAYSTAYVDLSAEL